ncbi:MAG: hypothetical protein VZQ62_01875 [Methanosphaera sp.]|nr:hypothetical protein [Methanosphaera sp.]
MSIVCATKSVSLEHEHLFVFVMRVFISNCSDKMMMMRAKVKSVWMI